MAQSITITYSNQSDNDTSDFLVFSRPAQPSTDAEAKAWLVVQHIGPGDSHVFRWTEESQIQVIWDDGNSFSNIVDALPGQLWQFTTVGNDYELVLDSGRNNPPQQIGVINNVPAAITVNVIKDAAVYASLSGVGDGQIAEFELSPHLWVGFGQPPQTTLAADYALMSAQFAPVNLSGRTAATITASGSAAAGYQFEVQAS